MATKWLYVAPVAGALGIGAGIGFDQLLSAATPDAAKQDLAADKAIALMAANPSCIRRPVVEHDGGLLVGFDPVQWDGVLE